MRWEERTDPEKFLDARTLKRDGTVVPTTLEMAESLFRNGALC